MWKKTFALALVACLLIDGVIQITIGCAGLAASNPVSNETLKETVPPLARAPTYQLDRMFDNTATDDQEGLTLIFKYYNSSTHTYEPATYKPIYWSTSQESLPTYLGDTGGDGDITNAYVGTGQVFFDATISGVIYQGYVIDIRSSTSPMVVYMDRAEITFTFYDESYNYLSYKSIYWGTSSSDVDNYLGYTDYYGQISTSFSQNGTVYFKTSDGTYAGSTYIYSSTTSKSVYLYKVPTGATLTFMYYDSSTYSYKYATYKSIYYGFTSTSPTNYLGYTDSGGKITDANIGTGERYFKTTIGGVIYRSYSTHIYSTTTSASVYLYKDTVVQVNSTADNSTTENAAVQNSAAADNLVIENTAVENTSTAENSVTVDNAPAQTTTTDNTTTQDNTSNSPTTSDNVTVQDNTGDNSSASGTITQDNNTTTQDNTGDNLTTTDNSTSTGSTTTQDNSTTTTTAQDNTTTSDTTVSDSSTSNSTQTTTETSTTSDATTTQETTTQSSTTTDTTATTDTTSTSSTSEPATTSTTSSTDGTTSSATDTSTTSDTTTNTSTNTSTDTSTTDTSAAQETTSATSPGNSVWGHSQGKDGVI